METIYINNGSNSFNAPITDSCERSHSLQQHNYVKLVWKSADNKPISANAYIEYEGQVFYALDDYFPTHKDGIYEYDIEFHAIEDTFNRPLFFRYVDILDQTTGETTSWKEIEWSLNGNLKTIADIVITCLNRAYDNAYFELPADSYTDTLLMSYSFSGNSIADALSTIAEQNETEWWLENTNEYADGKHKYILHFDKCELGTTIELNDNYTEDANGVWQSGGFKSVSQSSNTNIIPQKLYVYGSERNIIKKTVEEETEGGKMNVSYDKKLRLPKVFPSGIIGANGAIYENETLGLTITLNEDSSLSIGGINNHFEQVKIFDEVYPKMDMTIIKDGVSVQNPNGENPIYWLKADRLKSITTENPVDGSINPGKLGLLIEGCTLMCTFTSGLLNGREFECAWRESSAEIGLIPIDENDVQIPSDVFKPQEGDTFILWNLAMPQSSITIAQNELCVEAINYIEELATSITETDCVSEPEAFRLAGYPSKPIKDENENIIGWEQSIKVGQRITVTSDVFRNGKLASRIIKFSYKLTKPYDISFTLASSRQTGRLATLENMIADVTHEVHATGQVQRAISRRQWHDTEEMMSMLDSIQKQLVVVGDENNSFTTTCNLEYSDVTKILTISKGYLQHQSFTDNEWKGAWLINEAKQFNISTLDEQGTTPFYVYFVCSKNNNLGYVEVGSGLPEYTDQYVFVLGILSSEFEGERIFNQSSGLTSIAGGTVTTDVIQDPARRLIIDFSNATVTARNGGTIRGAIQFEKGEGENDLGTALESLLNKVQARENILEGAMIIDFDLSAGNNRRRPIRKTKDIKPNTEYVFSIESIVLKSGSVTPDNITIAIRNYSDSLSDDKQKWNIPFNTEKMVYTITTNVTITSNDYLYIYYGEANKTQNVGFTAFGVKLAEGNTYIGWESTPAEQQVLISLNNAMKGSTDIIGGLVLTNLIQLKNEKGDVSAGISGLETNDVFAWAGGTMEQAVAGDTPVLLKRNGTGSKIGCLVVEDDDKVRVKTTNGSVLIDADGGVSLYDSSDIETVRIKPDDVSVDDLSATHSVGTFAYNEILATRTNTATSYQSYAEKLMTAFNCTESGEYIIQIENSTKKGIGITSDVSGTYMPIIGDNPYISVYSEICLKQGDTYTILDYMSNGNTFTASGACSLSTTFTTENAYFKRYKVNLVKGSTYYLVYRCRCDGIGSTNGCIINATLKVTASSQSGTIRNYFLKQSSKTIIGNNGIMIAQNALSYFFANIYGIDNMDIRIKGLPTSSDELESGQLYDTGDGVLRIKN